MYKYNPTGWKYQPKIGGPGRISLLIGSSLECADVVGWDRASSSPGGISLGCVLDDFSLPGLPVEIRSRYNLEADFRRLQAWRGRMSGLWRRFRTARRDAEIRRLHRLGNPMRRLASFFKMSVSTIHNIVHRVVEKAASMTAQVARRPTRAAVFHPHERPLSLSFSGSSNTMSAELKICENMMKTDGWKPPQTETRVSVCTTMKGERR